MAVGHVDERFYRDARCLHLYQEIRNAPVLRSIGIVRASMKIHWEWCAMLVQIFCPLMTNSSPSCTARVCNEPRSEPALGSL